MIKSYTFLICAILAEALGTTTLKLSEQFSNHSIFRLDTHVP